MDRTERAELTVLCLIEKGSAILLQNRVKKDWQGYTLPGGHVEKGESFVDAVIREMKEETGLTVLNPRLCGVKQFPILDGEAESGRYIVFLFEADEFKGELTSSEEGQMHWVSRRELDGVNLVEDFDDLIDVMLSDSLSEFQYVIEEDEWIVVKK